MGLSGYITPVAGWPQTPKPAVGTAVLAADVVAGEQALDDKLAALSPDHPILVPVWHWIDGEWGVNGNNGNIEQTVSGSDVSHSLDIVHGRTVYSLRLYLQGPAHADFPGDQPTMPKLRVFEMVLSTGVETAIGPSTGVDDSSATDEDYEAVHTIDFECDTPFVVDRATKRYFAKITGEAGANFQPGLILLGVSVSYV